MGTGTAGHRFDWPPASAAILRRDHCDTLASDWLARRRDEPEFGVDTRVSVSTYVDRARRVARLWTTVGVRMMRLTEKGAS